MTLAPNADQFLPAPMDTTPASIPARAGRRMPETTLRELAAFHLLHGQTANAVALLKVALWADPKDGPALRLMGHALARSGKPVDAARLMVAASRAGGVRVKAADWKEIGLALLRFGNASLGMKFLTKYDQI